MSGTLRLALGMFRFSEPVPSVARGHACPHGVCIGTTGFRHAPHHLVLLKGKSFVVEPGGGAVDVTGAGGQEHRQPVRRAHVGVLGLRQLARHTGFGHVRVEAGAEGGGDADDEDECAEARRVLLRLRVEERTLRGCVAGGEGAWTLRTLGVPPERTANPRAAGAQLGRPQATRRYWESGGPVLALQAGPTVKRWATVTDEAGFAPLLSPGRERHPRPTPWWPSPSFWSSAWAGHRVPGSEVGARRVG